MKTLEATELICDMLSEKKKITVPEIAYAKKVPNIQIHAIIKKLVDAGIVEQQEVENGKTFLLSDPKKLQNYLEEMKPSSKNDQVELKKEVVKKELSVEPVEKEVPAPTNSGRDTTKYVFQKQTYPKGQCVLAVIREYIEKNKKLSIEELQQVFPDEIVGARLGVIRSLTQAKKISDQRPRYFMKDDQILKLTDGKSLVICSQWTSDKFVKFLKLAKELGYKISPA